MRGKEHIEPQLQKLPFKAFFGNDRYSKHSVTEAIISVLVRIGYKNNYFSFEDGYVNPGKNKHRVNVMWIDRESDSLQDPDVAFKVSGGVSKKSIERLNELPDETEKCVVSRSGNKTYIYDQVADRLPESFEHFDCEVWDI